jgi:hypothetical protein
VKNNSNCSRRHLLTASASGIAAFLAGCQQQISSSIEGEPETTEETTELTEESTGTAEEESEQGGGTVELQFDQEDRDEPIDVYNIVNRTSDKVPLAAIDPPREDDRYIMEYNLSPGESRDVRVERNDGEALLEPLATWTAAELQSVENESDVTATPTRIIESDDSERGLSAKVEYSLPNPTGIDSGSVEEALLEPQRDPVLRGDGRKYGNPQIKASSDGLSFRSSAPVGLGIFSVEAASVSESEQFTFSVDAQPSVDISIDNLSLRTDEEEVGEVTITFTAQSEVPVVESYVVIHFTGPNVSGTNRYTEEVRSNSTERTLIDSSVGEERIGQSKTITIEGPAAGRTFAVDSSLEFPLEQEDTIFVMIGAAATNRGLRFPNIRYPVGYIEQPIIELVN